MWHTLLSATSYASLEQKVENYLQLTWRMYYIVWELCIASWLSILCISFVQLWNRSSRHCIKKQVNTKRRQCLASCVFLCRHFCQLVPPSAIVDLHWATTTFRLMQDRKHYVTLGELPFIWASWKLKSSPAFASNACSDRSGCRKMLRVPPLALLCTFPSHLHSSWMKVQYICYTIIYFISVLW